MAAERMESDDKTGGVAGGGGGMESLFGDMDLGAMMKDLDPNTLQELLAEGMKDPQIQEMVSSSSSTCWLSCLLMGLHNIC